MDVAWDFPAIARHTTTSESRGMSGNFSAARAKGANEPAICVSGPRCYMKRCYMKRMKPPLHSGFVRRPRATSEKRSPINDVGKAKSYQSRFLCELNSGNARAGCCKCPHSSFYKKPKLRASVETVMRRRIQAIKDLDHARLELIHRSSNRISMSRHADHKWNQSVRNCHESHRRGMSGIRQ